MVYRYRLVHDFTVAPDVIYAAWMNSRAHSAMTGGAARISPRIGGRFTAWDGYIEGVTLELEPGRRIVQSWRTSEFSETDRDSKITVTLTPTKSGARLTLAHSGVPDGQTGYEKGGWQGSYFEPMERYFARRRR